MEKMKLSSILPSPLTHGVIPLGDYGDGGGGGAPG